VILSPHAIIDVADLHLMDHQVEPPMTSMAIQDMERQHIEKVLKAFNGNRKKTAEALGISEKGLYLKIKEYSLSSEF
jgi:DNA-binding NtrC family response regulator